MKRKISRREKRKDLRKRREICGRKEARKK